MDRRTILKRLGAASAGVAGLSATASADDSNDEPLFASLDRAIDVSDLSGQTPLTELLTEAELDQIDERVQHNPRELELKIDSDQSTVNELSETCFAGCCGDWDGYCPCDSCVCSLCST